MSIVKNILSVFKRESEQNNLVIASKIKDASSGVFETIYFFEEYLKKTMMNLNSDEYVVTLEEHEQKSTSKLRHMTIYCYRPVFANKVSMGYITYCVLGGKGGFSEKEYNLVISAKLFVDGVSGDVLSDSVLNLPAPNSYSKTEVQGFINNFLESIRGSVTETYRSLSDAFKSKELDTPDDYTIKLVTKSGANHEVHVFKLSEHVSTNNLNLARFKLSEFYTDTPKFYKEGEKMFLETVESDGVSKIDLTGNNTTYIAIWCGVIYYIEEDGYYDFLTDIVNEGI